MARSPAAILGSITIESLMRLLLLQIRHDPKVRQEERDSFLRYCHLEAEEMPP